MPRRFPFAALCLLAALVGSAFVQPAGADDKTSDEPLPKDAANVYGKYENGVKYIIRKNANPPGRVSVWLHIHTGSINETEQQRGLAHFMEHMSFNGSKNFKPGTLIPLMNHMGMVFGADSNAHTTLHETVYKLNLPDTKPETIDTAMTILSDMASALDISAVEIDSERRVILEELRASKSSGERIQKKVMKNLFANSRLANHDTGGDEEQIKTFPRDQFVDYWNTWYRPENMTLIVVGDINPDEMIAKGKEKLGTFSARGPERAAMKAELKPFTESRALIVTDPEQVTGDIGLVTLKPGRPPISTFAQFREQAVEGLGEWIVNRRFDDLVQKGGAPFRDANVGVGNLLNEAMTVSTEASGEPKDWNKMLDATIAEVTRAIDHGFTQRELDLAKKETLAGAERAVQTESSRESDQIVAGLAGAVGLDRPIMSAQQRLEITKKLLDSVTLDEIHKSFVNNFKSDTFAYILTMPEKPEGMTMPNEQDVVAAAKAAWAKKTQALEDQKDGGKLLASDPDAGTVDKKTEDQDLHITTVEFANGVVMHHKFNDYKKDSVAVRITMPGGKLEETIDNKGIGELASLMLARPATSKFTSSQLRDLMTGKNVSVRGGIALDTMALSISGSQKDVPAGMELAYALLTDGQLEQSAIDDWAKRSLQAVEERKKSPEGQLGEVIAKLIFNDDARMLPLNEAEINRLAGQRSQAQEWFKRIAGSAAIEVAIVGDIKLDAATDLVAKYVGSLPKRTGTFDALDKFRKLDRKSGPHNVTVRVPTITPKAFVLAGVFTCSDMDPDRRPLALAAQVISDRMNERLREKEQLVYGIGCSNQAGHGMPNTGIMLAAAPTDPKNADKLGDEIIEMMKDFADKGPTDDEVETAKKQIIQTAEASMKEPTFWLQQMSELRYRGRPLSDIKQLPKIYETFNAQQVQDAMKKYTNDQSVVRVEIIPESAPSTAPTTAPATVMPKESSGSEK